MPVAPHAGESDWWSCTQTPARIASAGGPPDPIAAVKAALALATS
ncbi:MAG: hypothetical protein ACRENE_24880 [Polyangiaceae bacterium]